MLLISASYTKSDVKAKAKQHGSQNDTPLHYTHIIHIFSCECAYTDIVIAGRLRVEHINK